MKKSKGFVVGMIGTLLLGAAMVGPRITAQTSDLVPALLADYKWRSIGPGAAGGRISDVEGINSDFRFAIAAAASGGVWKTTNAGTTWSPILDRYGASSIGDIAIFQKDPRILWVGTGEANNRNSVEWGDGIYKSSDGGKTFTQAPAPFGPNYDHHAMWIDPGNKDRFYLGHDKGLMLTHDHGSSFVFFDNLPIAQFYKVSYDQRDPYAVDGGLQDNGSWGTMSFTRDALGIRNDTAWKMHWDDGQNIAIDPTNWRTMYSEGTQGTFRVVDPLLHTDTSRRAAPRNIVNFKEATGKDPAAAEPAVPLPAPTRSSSPSATAPPQARWP